MKFPGVLFLGFLMSLPFSLNAKKYRIIEYSCSRDSLPGNILIINSFDAMSMKARKNKKELFEALTDSLKQVLFNEISAQKEGRPIVISELIKDTTDSDSTILLLILQNNASKAIVIKNLNVFFKQTGVDVTKEEGGKRRTASFDICAVINYHLYNSGANISNSEITSCGFFIQRNVVSGLLAAGPDIVGNRKYAHKIIKKNAEKYLRENQFFSF